MTTFEPYSLRVAGVTSQGRSFTIPDGVACPSRHTQDGVSYKISTTSSNGATVEPIRKEDLHEGRRFLHIPCTTTMQSASCGRGTTWSAKSKMCELDPSSCPHGTTWSEGSKQCVLEDHLQRFETNPMAACKEERYRQVELIKQLAKKYGKHVVPIHPIPHTQRKVVRPVVNTFKKIDSDGDGKLSAAEVEAFHREEGEQVPETFWARTDKDKDGFISWEEFPGPKGTEDPARHR